MVNDTEEYLKAVSQYLLLVNLFVPKCDLLLGEGSKICDSLWQGDRKLPKIAWQTLWMASYL